ncbi:class IV adenylate cyclase [Halovenus sp. WSH3]|uniref:Class IV adenylate cyclase n=1 Tax=Halovenus carboxidivorans TaxID=2692199 RepID=A0A6B0SZ87_9EURY|nr:class IV adenylate cyclase [Halovenus carboxidivorans]MXR50964.1 class IV adenylate cyclase [Halovenus carboxidivorans]
MYEVEVKVRADHDAVRDSLESVGAVHVESVEQEDIYYDAPDRDFAQTDEALRVREERSATSRCENDEEETIDTRLTYKGPLVDSDSKTRQEAETAVVDPEELRAILNGLGYEPAATVRKERERYTVEGVTVTLDTVDGLGEFVEAELETERDIDSARDRVLTLLTDLGLDTDEQIRTSYLGLLLSEE